MWQVLLTISVVFVVITLFGYLVHSWFHHPSSGSFYKAHLTHHFKLYPPNDYLSDQYRSPGKDNTAWLFLLLGSPLIVLPFILFGLHVISLSVLITAGVCMGVFGGAHDYLHDAFHIRHHWLRKFKWFDHLTHLHLLHHVDVKTNLGIYSFWWDRVFGSFRSK